MVQASFYLHFCFIVPSSIRAIGAEFEQKISTGGGRETGDYKKQ
jgi:hypothetical protein